MRVKQKALNYDKKIMLEPRNLMTIIINKNKLLWVATLFPPSARVRAELKVTTIDIFHQTTIQTIVIMFWQNMKYQNFSFLN